MPDRDRYRLCKHLSDKNNLKVDLVEDQMTGKRYIKKSLDRLQCSPLFYHQFKMEIDVLSQIQTPYIPQLVDVWENDHLIALIETWFEGEDLKSWARAHRKSLRRCRKRFVLELMDLLGKLHEQGFLYIDLKPENLIVVQEHLCLIDFNACIPTGSHRASLGTQRYMAPELLDSRRKEESADIYTIGAVFKQFFPLGLIRFWLWKCRRKDPLKRYASISEARHGLNRLLWGKRIGILIISIILSVFFSMFRSFTPADVVQEYEKEFLELRGSRPIKAQELLSKWIIDQRFETDVLKDADAASFFLDQGILSGNENIIRYLMDHVPQRTLESLSLESQLAVLRFQDPLTYPNIQKLLKQIVQEPSGLNQAYHFLQFEQVLLDKEIILEKEERNLVNDLISSWNQELVLKEKESFLELTLVHTEYILFLRTRNIKDLDVPELWLQEFQNEEIVEIFKDLDRRTA